MATINPGMDAEVFEQFIEQLHRYVRERLIPAEAATIANDEIPADIVQEMREMGLFGLTMPEEFGGAAMNISQYARTINENDGYAFVRLDLVNYGVFIDCSYASICRCCDHVIDR